MKLKILAFVLVLIPAIWFGWWYIAASGHQAAVDAWLTDRRSAGWQADVAEVSVTGFPNRLDTVLANPALADPQSGWAWEAERIDIRQVIYDPTFFVIEWPTEQRIAAPGARAILRNEEMEASLKVAAASTLDMERASFDLQRAFIEAEAGWTASADRFTAHLRAAPDAGPDNAYEFRIDAAQIRPPEFIRRMVDPTGTLPAHLETALAEGRVALDRPLNRLSLEGAKPQIEALSLKDARAEWGGLKIAIDGGAIADADGYAEGSFDINAENWQEMLDTAVAAGALSPGFADTLKSGLGFVARLGGNANRLDVSLKLGNGIARIGPVPIGRAPRLRN